MSGVEMSGVELSVVEMCPTRKHSTLLPTTNIVKFPKRLTESKPMNSRYHKMCGLYFLAVIGLLAAIELLK